MAYEEGVARKISHCASDQSEVTDEIEAREVLCKEKED